MDEFNEYLDELADEAGTCPCLLPSWYVQSRLLFDIRNRVTLVALAAGVGLVALAFRKED